MRDHAWSWPEAVNGGADHIQTCLSKSSSGPGHHAAVGTRGAGDLQICSSKTTRNSGGRRGSIQSSNRPSETVRAPDCGAAACFRGRWIAVPGPVRIPFRGTAVAVRPVPRGGTCTTGSVPSRRGLRCCGLGVSVIIIYPLHRALHGYDVCRHPSGLHRSAFHEDPSRRREASGNGNRCAHCGTRERHGLVEAWSRPKVKPTEMGLQSPCCIRKPWPKRALQAVARESKTPFVSSNIKSSWKILTHHQASVRVVRMGLWPNGR